MTSVTTSAMTGPRPVQGIGRGLRILLVTVSIAALLSLAFVLGRVSVGSTSVPTRPPAVSTHVPASGETETCQQVGHYMSGGC